MSIIALHMEKQINRYRLIADSEELIRYGTNDFNNETLFRLCKNIATLHHGKPIRIDHQVSVPLEDGRIINFSKVDRVGIVDIELKDREVEPRDAIPQRISLRQHGGEFILYRHGQDDKLKKTNQGPVRIRSMAQDLWFSYLAAATKS